MINPAFAELPQEFQRESLALIERVNRDHLHCNDKKTWERVHSYITLDMAHRFYRKLEKKEQAQAAAQPVLDQAKPAPTPAGATLMALASQGSQNLFTSTKKELMSVYHDSAFVEPVMEAFQTHILHPFSGNAELALALCLWITKNAMFLPLGTHLLPSFLADMGQESEYAKKYLASRDYRFYPEARAPRVEAQMSAFLSDTAAAHSKSYVEPPAEGPKTAVVLSVKNGAGGHTAPHRAMEAQLRERGWKVVTICYDTDFKKASDPVHSLGITFADGSPMTETLYETSWKMQKQCKEEARIVKSYVQARMQLTPHLFEKDEGGDLLRRQVLPLNPKLIVTTMAYHWSWKSLAYRIRAAKTLLVASDVFLHPRAIEVWLRQLTVTERLRQVHFTTMTDDLSLLRDGNKQHDLYYRAKSPGDMISIYNLFDNFKLDTQISVIGAPINPSFEAITSEEEIKRLREKWNVPEGSLSICISRGKLGYHSDFIPALEGYRTGEILEKPIVLQVVCGENTQFYQELCKGKFNDLGPSITVVPHPLLGPKDFAELRSISTIDDIKAGGASTFEGWYLISKGAKTLLLLTPGPKLWWENSNCVAMEKWGVGRTVTEKTGKIAIIKELIKNGLPELNHRFPDWKEPFDKVVRMLT